MASQLQDATLKLNQLLEESILFNNLSNSKYLKDKEVSQAQS